MKAEDAQIAAMMGGSWRGIYAQTNHVLLSCGKE
jgi:hypothetical protein